MLIVSAHCDAEYVARATWFGAVGYVLKQSSLEELAGAIRWAAQGRIYVSPAVERCGCGTASSSSSGVSATGVPQLTVREAEVLQLIAESRCNKEIARELGISVKTVEKHRQGVMTKLDIHDVAGLTQYAMAAGVIERCTRGAAV